MIIWKLIVHLINLTNGVESEVNFSPFMRALMSLLWPTYCGLQMEQEIT